MSSLFQKAAKYNFASYKQLKLQKCLQKNVDIILDPFQIACN